jgi:RNA polymerase sigma-70 factor (ECF subfamily)
MQTDADIMRQVQAGDEAVFAELVARYQVRLLRFATSKLRNAEAADDLVQETFLAAFRSRQSYSPCFAFSTWIWTILLNLCRHAARARYRQQQLLQEYSRRESRRPWGDVLPALEIEESREQLNAWLTNLSEEEADAIRLRFFGDLTYEQIALAMDSSLNGAKTRVRRGLLKLAEIARHDPMPKQAEEQAPETL